MFELENIKGKISEKVDLKFRRILDVNKFLSRILFLLGIKEQLPSLVELSEMTVRRTKKGFRLQEEVKKRKGPFIEVAGPTETGFSLYDQLVQNRPFFVSNITAPGVAWYEEGKVAHFFGRVNFQADATRLPLKDESVGIVFGVCLGPDFIEGAILESGRVLEDGGLLFLEEFHDKHIFDIAEAAGLCLVLKKTNKYLLIKDTLSYCAIFQKKSNQ
ncbi:MAG: hypothetical protein PHS44_02995 [Candidatus Dojkabacteria bacterium]|jgi:hypothetical protein|nr:hypothetical protein [Candidatus Dojkabacteria bacterium]